MELLKGNVITIKSGKYIIIETLNYNYEKYLFTNKLKDDEDIGEEFYIFKAENDKVVKLTDEEKINKLLEKFRKLINEDIENILSINER